MRSILISGAAQGIGAAIARLFYAHHYKVGIYDINSAQAQQLAASLGPNAKAGQLDVSNYQDWQTALAEFVTWAGELNILVNNAGILFSGPFEQTEISAHHKNHVDQCQWCTEWLSRCIALPQTSEFCSCHQPFIGFSHLWSSRFSLVLCQ